MVPVLDWKQYFSSINLGIIRFTTEFSLYAAPTLTRTPTLLRTMAIWQWVFATYVWVQFINKPGLDVTYFIMVEIGAATQLMIGNQLVIGSRQSELLQYQITAFFKELPLWAGWYQDGTIQIMIIMSKTEDKWMNWPVHV